MGNSRNQGIIPKNQRLAVSLPSLPEIAVSKIHTPSNLTMQNMTFSSTSRLNQPAQHSFEESEEVRRLRVELNNQEAEQSGKVKTNLMRVFNDNVILIDPNVDASEKEIYARNGYRIEGKHLKQFAEHGEVPQYKKQGFQPSHFGKLSKNAAGQIVATNQKKRKPLFETSVRIGVNRDGTIAD